VRPHFFPPHPPRDVPTEFWLPVLVVFLVDYELSPFSPSSPTAPFSTRVQDIFFILVAIPFRPSSSAETPSRSLVISGDFSPPSLPLEPLSSFFFFFSPSSRCLDASAFFSQLGRFSLPPQRVFFVFFFLVSSELSRPLGSCSFDMSLFFGTH